MKTGKKEDQKDNNGRDLSTKKGNQQEKKVGEPTKMTGHHDMKSMGPKPSKSTK